MNYLAIDTCGNNLTVILSYNGNREVYFEENCGVNHSVSLMPKIEELKLKLNADFKKLDFMSVVVGAGSFTGIRIGISTIKALAFVNNVKVKSITSFDTLSYNMSGKKVLAVIDALHNNFYICGYENNNVVLQPEFCDLERVKVLSNDFILISNKEIEGLKTEIVSIKDGLIKASEERQEVLDNLDKLEALYIRKSQAEEGR